ncbi:uncharacterized protein LOC115879710 [Sitophilus oryzae]|uniref:Uncharacterized protein LOC115879710 n=1 Tax=Sitophilus oryzae TaxID=7048 RepID=A0A6J2XLX3_SITOR|nr:uncharacterized protein LOC115879710 [Sitophilus oryzae]
METLIAMCDITGYLIVYCSVIQNQQTLAKILKDINIFSKYCNKEVILEADEQCTYYTKYLLIYLAVGLGCNLGWPLISTKHCIRSRGTDFHLKHNPCGMPTQNFYPFDASKPHIFWIVYMMEANYCVHICYAFSLATAMVTGLLIHIIAQLKNCGAMFENVFNENEENLDGFKDAAKRKFITCVKYHQEILLYTERVFNVFSRMLIIYVTMTSFTLATD